MTDTALPKVCSALNTSPPPAIGAWVATPSVGVMADAYDSGKYRITGTTKRKGTPDSPTRVRVCLFDQLSKRLARETWSDAATGAYAFTCLRSGTYFVVSFDHTGAFNAVIADNVASELMP